MSMGTEVTVYVYIRVITNVKHFWLGLDQCCQLLLISGQ